MRVDEPSGPLTLRPPHNDTSVPDYLHKSRPAGSLCVHWGHLQCVALSASSCTVLSGRSASISVHAVHASADAQEASAQRERPGWSLCPGLKREEVPSPSSSKWMTKRNLAAPGRYSTMSAGYLCSRGEHERFARRLVRCHVGTDGLARKRWRRSSPVFGFPSKARAAHHCSTPWLFRKVASALRPMREPSHLSGHGAAPLG
jgi:hypothetical protein